MRDKAKTSVSYEEFTSGFRDIGLKPGDVVLAHSAMRTFGRINGGANTVVDALLEVIGPRGTLVVPTFTFAHEAKDGPVIDPANDPSEMGIITETFRKRPEALRSTAFRHSFAAIGLWSEVITDIDPALSPFDMRSSFGVMLGLGAQVVFLGVTYISSTSHHFAEWVCEVPYRQKIPRQAKIRRPDGLVVDQGMMDYQPKSEGGSYYGSRIPDFNRLGKMLEDRGVVGTTFIGNAAVRRFPMRNLVDLAQKEAEVDYNIFRCADPENQETTVLEFGVSTMSPELTDGAGRKHEVEWCVKNLSQLEMPPCG